MADAPRGITIEPPIITGSSTRPLNSMPACEPSTSMAWVSRTLIGVPAGTVTTFGGRRRSRRHGWLGGRLRCWRRSFRRLRAPRTRGDRVGNRHLGHLAVLEQHADGLAVRADEHAFDDLAGSELDPIGRKRRAGRDDAGPSPATEVRRVVLHGALSSLDDRQRGRHLQVDDQQQLMLDLQELERRLWRQRRSEARRRIGSSAAFRRSSRSTARVASDCARSSVICE